jgi:hypothetical protein
MIPQSTLIFCCVTKGVCVGLTTGATGCTAVGIIWGGEVGGGLIGGGLIPILFKIHSLYLLEKFKNIENFI